ncbi:MAG TPA: SCO1664 family protein [Candidatus Dormibacteraeota bacterium]|nr:SCO1664 family protein [Candidatus Dormibacteraeota bacterium]
MPEKEREEPGLLTADPADVLRRARLEVVGRLAYSSNGTFLVRCRDEQVAEPAVVRLAVYKPAAGERPLWDFPPDSLHRREVAAYELSRWLGWDLVPVTVARDGGELGRGSLQAFVDHDPEQHYFTLQETHRRTFKRLAFFDILANNADRKAGHCLVDAEGKVWAIDHGLTFHVEPKLRTVIWDFGGQPLPAPERKAAARLEQALADPASDISVILGSLLSSAEVEALSQRARKASVAGLFPQPDSSWAFPWPLV